jgi:hypothetical protein
MAVCARCQVVLGLPDELLTVMWVKWAGWHDRTGTRVNLCPRCDTELVAFLRERSPAAAAST